MKLPAKLGRYAAVATLLMKYGRLTPGDPNLFLPPEDPGADASPGDLARDLEDLGPAFVKLGQLLSTRPEFLPPQYLQSLERLQDDVTPVGFEEVACVVEEELGARLSKAFATFEAEPLAAASLGQVHRATLRDGRTVAVKVQRPGIVDRVRADLEILKEIAAFLDRHSEASHRFNVTGVVQELEGTLAAELDYVGEAQNLELLKTNLAEYHEIVVPEPIQGYSTSRVLTMEFVEGTKVTAIHPLARIDVDTRALGRAIISAYLKQIVLDGVFHADPHPGNVLVTPDGRLALIDLGMVGRLGPALQDSLLKLLLALSTGRGEDAADIVSGLGERLADFNEPAFRRAVAMLVNRHTHQPIGRMKVGLLFMQLQSAASAHGLRSPQELALLGKALLNLDQVARALDPSIDVTAAIGEDTAELMTRRLAKSAASGSLYAAAFEAKEVAERLPGRINRVLDSLAASELKLKVEMIDEGAVLEGLQKVANRITVGLVIAALIIGAALIMRIETSFRLLGYPGVAMILFMVAATAGLWLAWQAIGDDGRRTRS